MIIKESLFPGMGLADPHAVVENGRVYLFCGHDKSPLEENICVMDKWYIVSSDNLVDWRIEGEILPTQTYIGDQNHCWAGYIKKKNNKYYWYFSNKNIDTGVMVSDNVTGPFKDALGKPLIPFGISPTKSYDPTVFEENGECTIFFGVTKYHAAKLNDDMISLAEEPKPIMVYDENGNHRGIGDKSTVYKHNGMYYLIAGENYAMSDKLMGPYKYMGNFLGGGHNDIFEFKGKLYVACEYHESNVFYRGVMIKELKFNEDGTVFVPEDDKGISRPSKLWDFKYADMGWHLSDGTRCLENGVLRYPVDKEVSLLSALYPGVVMPEDKKLIIDFDNKSDSKSISVTITTIDIVDVHKNYWREDRPHDNINATFTIDGTENQRIEVPIDVPNKPGKGVIRIKIDVAGTEGEVLVKRIEIK